MMLIVRKPRVRRGLVWAASLILFLSSAAMLTVFVILPLFFGLRGVLGSIETIILGLVSTSALALLIIDRIYSRRREEEEKDAWLTDEHINLMVSGLEDYAIFFLDPDGNVISWNNGAARIKGYQADEIIGQHFSIFYTEEDKVESVPLRNLDEALRKGKLKSEGWRLRKDGTRFRADVLITPFYDDEDNLRAYAKITKDITLWHQAQTRLEESERRLAEAQRVAQIGNWEWYIETGDLFWSDEMTRIYGHDPAEFSPTYEAFLRALPPTDRKRVSDTIDQALESGKPFEFEHKVIRPDGKIRTLYGRAQIEVDKDGRPMRMFGTAQDISDRVELEHSYLIQAGINQSIVRAQSDLGQGVFIVEREKLLFINEPVHHIFQLPAGEINTVDHFLNLVGLGRDSSLGHSLTATPSELGELDRGYQFVDGEDGIHLEYAATSMRVDHQIRRIVLIQDITERRELQLRLEKSREKLRRYSAELNRSVEQERANISRHIHDELGQQLTGLKMDLSALSNRINGTGDPDLPFVSHKIMEMTELIDTTIESVRKLATELRPGILDDLGLRAALEWQATEFKKRTGIACTFECSNLAAVKDEISTAIFRIAQEALTNVSRHAEATHVEILLYHDNRELVLEVKDNGNGITANSLLGIGKTSLGILGMHERAEILGGQTIVTPRSSQGTTVHVSIPLDKSEGEF